MALVTEIGWRISTAPACWQWRSLPVETASRAKGSAVCHRREKVKPGLEIHKKEHEPDAFDKILE